MHQYSVIIAYAISYFNKIIILRVKSTDYCTLLCVFTQWGIFSRSALNFHGVQQLEIFAIKTNIKTASADETKTSTNAEKPLFTRF